MKTFAKFLLVLAFTVWCVSCEKDELTLPVKVNFSVNFDNPATGSITFNSGLISIGKISCDGKREVGEDVYFESNPNLVLQNIKFTPETDSSIIHFDIPQGVYTYLNWKIYLKDLNSLSDDLEIEDDNVGLIFYGSYTNTEGIFHRVYLLIDSFEFFNVQAFDDNGSGSLTLSTTRDYYASLNIDFNYVFSGISQSSIDEAEVEEEDEELIITISSDSNQDLYDQLLFRIQNSAKVIFR